MHCGRGGAGWISRERTKLVVKCHLSGMNAPEDGVEGASREIMLRDVPAVRAQSQVLWDQNRRTLYFGDSIWGQGF